MGRMKDNVIKFFRERNEYIELEEMNVIIKIPKDSARLEIRSYIFDEDGEVTKVGNAYNAEDIRRARADFLDNVEFGDDYDAVYTLTDLGLEIAEQIKRGEAP